MRGAIMVEACYMSLLHCDTGLYLPIGFGTERLTRNNINHISY